MHKKLAAELNSLAHDILKMRDKHDVFILREKIAVLHEKIAVLAYIEEYIDTTPQAKETKEGLVAKFEAVEKKEQVEVEKTQEIEKIIEKPEIEEEKPNEIILSVDSNQALNSIEVIDEEEVKVTEISEKIESEITEDIVEEKLEEETIKEAIEKKEDDDPKIKTLDDELEDTISVDVMTDLFKKVESKIPQKEAQTSLNDKLAINKTIQIGLNDRIAFVNNLFNYDQVEFNKVIRELNTFESFDKSLKFIRNQVKPNYDWKDKEEYEERFVEIIHKRFE